MREACLDLKNKKFSTKHRRRGLASTSQIDCFGVQCVNTRYLHEEGSTGLFQTNSHSDSQLYQELVDL